MIIIPVHPSEVPRPQPQDSGTLSPFDLCILSHVIGDHLFALHRYAGSLPTLHRYDDCLPALHRYDECLPALHRYDNCKNMQATCPSYPTTQTMPPTTILSEKVVQGRRSAHCFPQHKQVCIYTWVTR